jgi:hypothetical protein
LQTSLFLLKPLLKHTQWPSVCQQASSVFSVSSNEWKIQYVMSRFGSQVLFPLRIDNTILTYPEPWAENLRTRHIADLTKPDEYKQAFAHLLYHLKAASKG